MTNIISKEVAVAVANSTYNHARAMDTMAESIQVIYDVLVAYIPKGFINKRKSFTKGIPVSHYQDEIQQAWDIMPTEVRNAIDSGHARAMDDNFKGKDIKIAKLNNIWVDAELHKLEPTKVMTVRDCTEYPKSMYQVLHNVKADSNLEGESGPSLKEFITPSRDKGQVYNRTKNSRLLGALKGLHKVSNNVKSEVLPIKMRITKAYNTMLKTYNVSQKDSEAWIDKRDQDALVTWFDSYPFK
jgi:hypothetical protein